MKKLEELFNLPQDVDIEEDVPDDTETTDIVTTEALSNLQKIDEALPAIRGLESSDKEMDDIAKLAIDSYKDLMDLGMNIEARVASEILGSASQFLGHAITARNAKINKKLKMVDLLLKKAKLDHDRGDAGASEGTGTMLDRNELLAEILKANKADKENDKTE